MTSTPSLTDARAALQACVELGRIENMDAEILEVAAYGLKVMRFIENNADLFRDVERIEREMPTVAAVYRAFPGARVVAIRETR